MVRTMSDPNNWRADGGRMIDPTCEVETEPRSVLGGWCGKTKDGWTFVCTRPKHPGDPVHTTKLRKPDVIYQRWVDEED